MKNNITNSLRFAALLLLVVGAFAKLSAQEKNYTTVDASPEGGFFLDAGPAFLTGAESDTADHIGVTIGGGYRFNQGIFGHKFRLDLGYLYHDSTEQKAYDYMGWHSGKQKNSVTMALVGYDLHIPLNITRTVELRLGGSVGYAWVGEEFSPDDSDGKAEFKESAYAYGVGGGVTWHLGKRLYLDVGYRYMLTGDLDGNLDSNIVGYAGKVSEKLKGHFFTASIGYKF